MADHYNVLDVHISPATVMCISYTYTECSVGAGRQCQVMKCNNNVCMLTRASVLLPAMQASRPSHPIHIAPSSSSFALSASSSHSFLPFLFRLCFSLRPTPLHPSIHPYSPIHFLPHPSPSSPTILSSLPPPLYPTPTVILMYESRL